MINNHNQCLTLQQHLQLKFFFVSVQTYCYAMGMTVINKVFICQFIFTLINLHSNKDQLPLNVTKKPLHANIFN